MTLQAAFSAEPVSGPAPLMVQFTDESTGDPTLWAWNFDDGTHQHEDLGPSPECTYLVPGTYSPTLTVARDDPVYDESTETKLGLITVTAPVEAPPTEEPPSGQKGRPAVAAGNLPRSRKHKSPVAGFGRHVGRSSRIRRLRA